MDEPYKKINASLIKSNTKDGTTGSRYDYLDQPVVSAQYYYKLEEVDLDGTTSSGSAITIDFLSAVAEEIAPPDKFDLKQNYPNPFNPSITIEYQLPHSSYVEIRIYNLNGQLIQNLVHENKDAGYYAEIWDATDNAGIKVGSGIYLVRMKAGDFSKTFRLTLLK